MMVLIWKMLKEGVSFQDVHNRNLLERKKKRYEYEKKRLKRLSKECGVEEFRRMIRGVLEREQTILTS
jgi:sulfite reductase beta subunit-like hemoprotein